MGFGKKTIAFTGALVASALLGSVRHAAADVVSNVSTGLDASNNVIASGGVLDAHWTSAIDPTFDPTGTTQTVFPNNADWFGGWQANDSSSDWIARNANVTDNGPAPYSFSTSFDLTGYNLATASLSGGWAIDDQGTLSLNGNVIDTLGTGSWGSLTAFTAPSSDFVAGLNTLSITITADDRFLEAVRLNGTVTASPAVPAAAPLPNVVWTGFALFAGTGVLALTRRRKVMAE